jgi:hypothetical protein
MLLDLNRFVDLDSLTHVDPDPKSESGGNKIKK